MTELQWKSAKPIAWIWIALIVGFLAWGWLDVRNRGRINPKEPWTHMTDFTVYTAAGSAILQDRDPYVAENPRGWRYLYPPLFAVLVAPLSHLQTEDQVMVWYLISCVCLYGCYRETQRLGREALGRPWGNLRMFGAFAATALPTLDCLQRGQMGVFLLYPLLLGLRLVTERPGSALRWFLGGLVLSFPAAIKLTPALPVLILVLMEGISAYGAKTNASMRLRRPGFLAGGLVAGGLLYLFAIPGAVMGWETNLGRLATWSDLVLTNAKVGESAGFHIQSVRNQSPGNALELIARSYAGRNLDYPGPPPYAWLPIAVTTLRVAILGMLAVVAWLCALRGDRLAQLCAFGLACTATLLVSPLSWGHYYLIMLPALLAVPTWLEAQGNERVARMLAIFGVIPVWLHYLFLHWVGGFGVLGFGMTAWFVIASWMMCRYLIFPCESANDKSGD